MASQDGERGLNDTVVVVAEDTEWLLPVRVEPFLDWLDGTRLGKGTEDSLARFLKTDVGKKMPATLRNDLRAEGWLAAAEYAESVGFR